MLSPSLSRDKFGVSCARMSHFVRDQSLEGKHKLLGNYVTATVDTRWFACALLISLVGTTVEARLEQAKTIAVY